MHICAREGTKLTVKIDDRKIYTKPFEWLETSYYWEVKQDFEETFVRRRRGARVYRVYRECIKTLAARSGPGTSSNCRESLQTVPQFHSRLSSENIISALKL